MEIKTGTTSHESDDPVVPPDRVRQARKKAAQKPKRSRQLGAKLLQLARVLALLALIGLLVVTGFSIYRYIYSAGLLTVRNISVSGCRHSDPAAIEAIVRHDFNANILRIELKDLRARIEKEVWVRKAEIRRVLPASLKIYVEERVPSVVAQLGEELVLLDEEGVLLDVDKPDYGKLDVPVFTGLRGDDAASYRVMQDENSARVRVGVQVLAELASGSADYLRSISEIDLSDPANVKLMMVDDTAEILLGDRDFLKRFQTFMANLGGYQEEESQRGEIATVDLRFNGQIVFRRNPAVVEQADAKSKTSRNH